MTKPIDQQALRIVDSMEYLPALAYFVETLGQLPLQFNVNLPESKLCNSSIAAAPGELTARAANSAPAPRDFKAGDKIALSDIKSNRIRNLRRRNF